MTRLIFATLLACTACAPRPPAVQLNPAACSTSADSAAALIHMIAEGLQLNAATDPHTRADPYPCARATYAAQQNHTPLPRCYYLPMGAPSVAVGWVP